MTMTIRMAQCIVDLLVIQGRLWEMRYSPDQPRDEHGRFTFGAGGAGKSGKNGLTKKSSRVKMGYKEAKLVISEINTYYHSRYEGKPVCRYYSGIYSKAYIFENHGFGDYRFTKAAKIK